MHFDIYILILTIMEFKDWFYTYTFHHSQFSDIQELVKLKQKKNLKISVALPP